jgi:ribosome-associated translation inhibitor RaiA
MKQPLQLSFEGMQPSAAIEAAVRAKARKLERFSSDIISCRVAIELAHKHRRHGRLVGVRIELAIPGRELTAGRVEHAEVQLALRDAFDDMRRQLEDAVRLQRAPQAATHGRQVKRAAADDIDDKETAR